MLVTPLVIVALIAIIAGAVIGIVVHKKKLENKLDSAEDYSKKLILEASKQAETIRKEAQLQAKDKLYQMKLDFEDETKSRTKELQPGKKIVPKRGNLRQEDRTARAKRGTNCQRRSSLSE